MRKKILVISHERSGTHFLMNTIAQCFDYLPEQIDLDNSQRVDWRNTSMAKQWMAQYKGRFVANIFKSHHGCPILEPLISEHKEEFHIFYIRRDGRDVMTSFWNYLNRLAPGWGPQTGTVGEFMRATAFGGVTQYQHQQNPTMLQRWVDHIQGWQHTDEAINFVSYEDLHTQFDQTVEWLACILGEPAVRNERPTLESLSSLPWKGKIGTWKDFFSEDDKAYYEQISNQLKT